jgi:hypothetical protein
MQEIWQIKELLKSLETKCKSLVVLEQRKIENLTKIAIHINLWKYDQILIIQKSLTIEQLKFHRKDSSYEFIILYYIIYWVLITNLECELI